MIDISTERVVSLTDACKLLPARRMGKKPNLSTLYRWAQRGCRGVKLEVIQVGACKCTSQEALQRFCEALTDPTAAKPTRTARQRERQIAAADAELSAAGI